MDLQNRLNQLKDRYQSIAGQFDKEFLHKEIRELEARMNKEGFWNEPEKSSVISRQLSDKQKMLNILEELETRINNALEISGEPAMEEELKTEINHIDHTLGELELKLFLSGPHDSSDAILAIHAGTGGVEAMDWASMLARMYQRYFEKMDWKVEVSDESFGEEAGYKATDFIQKGFHMNFKINGVDFSMNGIGKHNMENALAATTVANQMGIDLTICAEAIKKYEGIDRRNQVIGQKNGIWVIDDYAHNPAKVAAAIRAAQLLSKKVIAWFQPHGYGPTRFLREEFVKEISKSLRSEDEIWMSEIFYAGGTIVKDISAADLINDLTALGSKAYFIENRNDLASSIKSHTTNDCTILLMGARDPTLGDFAKEFFAKL